METRNVHVDFGQHSIVLSINRRGATVATLIEAARRAGVNISRKVITLKNGGKLSLDQCIDRFTFFCIVSVEQAKHLSVYSDAAELEPGRLVSDFMFIESSEEASESTSSQAKRTATTTKVSRKKKKGMRYNSTGRYRTARTDVVRDVRRAEGKGERECHLSSGKERSTSGLHVSQIEGATSIVKKDKGQLPDDSHNLQESNIDVEHTLVDMQLPSASQASGMSSIRKANTIKEQDGSRAEKKQSAGIPKVPFNIKRMDTDTQAYSMGESDVDREGSTCSIRKCQETLELVQIWTDYTCSCLQTFKTNDDELLYKCEVRGRLKPAAARTESGVDRDSNTCSIRKCQETLELVQIWTDFACNCLQTLKMSDDELLYKCEVRGRVQLSTAGLP